ncbi:hypothetical protein PUN28_005387 [Cardiocondyla obscurior]|uniref:Uncharacterized protein n=1 Tax=Cardiocondyla obscurior TaxID=286306 RepID=A0AAW2GFL7_9HYME
MLPQHNGSLVRHPNNQLVNYFPRKITLPCYISRNFHSLLQNMCTFSGRQKYPTTRTELMMSNGAATTRPNSPTHETRSVDWHWFAHDRKNKVLGPRFHLYLQNLWLPHCSTRAKHRGSK